MLYGSYEHTLDEKKRLVVPSKIREGLSKKLFIVRGFEGCISIYPEAEFNLYLEKLSLLDENAKLSRDFKRVALSSAFELEIDSKNRIQIPAQVIAKYSLENDVTVVGMLDHLEVWNTNNWKAYLKENEVLFEKKAEELLEKKNG